MKTIDYLEATQQIEKGQVASLYILLGEGYFLKEHLLKALSQSFLKEEGELRRCDLAQGIAGFWEDAGSICLFSRHRVLHLKGLRSLKAKEREELLAGLPPACPDDVLVLDDPEHSTENLKALALREGFFVNDPVLHEERLRGFVTRSFAARGQQIETEAVEYLLAHSEHTLEFLQGEIEKIALFSDPGAPIRPAQVEECLYPTEEGAAFNLVDAIAAGQPRQALVLLATLLGRDRSGVGSLLFLLFRQFRLLLQLSEISDRTRVNPATLAAKWGVHPFAVRKALSARRSFSRAQALAALAELAEIDTRIKRGGEEASFLLERFIVHFAV
jgi:DNA polymerase III delta subunit